MDREFFESLGRQGLTFDDVLLEPGHSRLEPDEIPVDAQFSRGVGLKVPFVGAAMDTITRHRMAIALASFGGIGVIDRNLSPKDQAAEVDRVKHHLHGVIEKPITVREDETIEAILNWRTAKNFEFDTFPVVDANGKMVGLMTRTDFDFVSDVTKTAGEAMSPLESMIVRPAGLSPQDAWEMMKLSKKKVLPLVDKDGRPVEMYVFADVKRIVSGDASAYNLDPKGRLRVAAAVGTLDDAYERVPLLLRKGVDVVVLDSAHTDTDRIEQTAKDLKRRHSGFELVVGNISTAAAAKRLVDWGADGIKIGQGPGSICTTRSVTGAGKLQLTAIANCALAIEGSGVPVCADGGLEASGHITIALAAGAHSVMMGKLLAGTDECPGEIREIDGVRCKFYRGMGSPSSMRESRAAQDRYRQLGRPRGKTVPEGVDGWVPYQGPVKPVLDKLIGGLRAGLGMVGAESIPDLHVKARFERLTSAGQVESRPHGLRFIEGSSNPPGGVS